MIFTEVIEVAQPVAVVHAFVSDFKNLPRWDPSIVRVEQTTPDPVGKGTRYVVVLRFLGVELTMDYETTAYDPPARAVLQGTAANAQATDTMTVEPTATGSRVTWVADIALTWPSRIFDPLLRLLFYPSVQTAVANLRAVLEGLGAPGETPPACEHEDRADKDLPG